MKKKFRILIEKFKTILVGLNNKIGNSNSKMSM
jgi:hypothetical protein